MRRRDVIRICGALAVGQGLALFPRLQGVAFALTRYNRARLLLPSGEPLKASGIEKEVNYLFFYPFNATPCFLLKLDGVQPAEIFTADGAIYRWGGGVGPEKNLVAFTAICSHTQTHPTPAMSAIKYDPGQKIIHCCAHRSEFNPAAGGAAMAGPTTKPLAAITLDWDKKTDELRATGVLGPETFGLFFKQFKRDLKEWHGNMATAREAVTECKVGLLKDYSPTLITCPRL